MSVLVVPSHVQTFLFVTCVAALSSEERLFHYLGLANHVTSVNCSTVDRKLLYQFPSFMPNFPRYGTEIFDYMKSANVRPGSFFLFHVGDNRAVCPAPTFAKSGPVRGGCTIVQLNKARHWDFKDLIRKYDLNFKDKSGSRVFWRGESNGWEHTRKLLFTRNDTRACTDIAITRWAAKSHGPGEVAPEVALPLMLQYKYLLSVEGNDVATNLKWLLASESVAFKRKARVISWALEHLLVPGIHFVALKDDFSNICDQHKFCVLHEKDCEEISRQATVRMQIFNNASTEFALKRRCCFPVFQKCTLRLHHSRFDG